MFLLFFYFILFYFREARAEIRAQDGTPDFRIVLRCPNIDFLHAISTLARTHEQRALLMCISSQPDPGEGTDSTSFPSHPNQNLRCTIQGESTSSKEAPE
jgi:hypothetical protein